MSSSVRKLLSEHNPIALHNYFYQKQSMYFSFCPNFHLYRFYFNCLFLLLNDCVLLQTFLIFVLFFVYLYVFLYCHYVSLILFVNYFALMDSLSLFIYDLNILFVQTVYEMPKTI